MGTLIRSPVLYHFLPLEDYFIWLWMIDGAISTLTEDRIILVCEVNGVLRTGSRTIRRPHLDRWSLLQTVYTGWRWSSIQSYESGPLKKTTFDYPVVEDYDDLNKYVYYERLKISSLVVLGFSVAGWFSSPWAIFKVLNYIITYIILIC